MQQITYDQDMWFPLLETNSASGTNPWVAPVIGLVGVAVGGILGFLGNWFADKRRWERENETRWHDRRRDVYARVLAAAQELNLATVATRAAFERGDKPDPTPFEQALDALYRVTSEAILISSPETGALMLDLQVEAFVAYAEEGSARKLGQMCARLVELARTEFGLPPKLGQLRAGAIEDRVEAAFERIKAEWASHSADVHPKTRPES